MFLANLFIYSALRLKYMTLATFGGLRHFRVIALWLTPEDPCMTLTPSMRYTLGFFLPNLVAMGHS